MTTALFLFDTVLDSLMIVLALRIGGSRIRPGRVVAAAMMGACAALWCRAASLTRAQTALLWLPAAMLMMTIAGGRQAKGCFRAGLLLLCAAGLMGGMVQALLGATESYAAAYACGGLCTAAIAGNAVRTRRAAGDAARAKLTIVYRGSEATFDAMIDSGNTMRDYLMHLPVIVLPQQDGRARLGLGDVPLRPIFADTAGGRQMMDCFIPERVSIVSGRQERTVRAAAALSPGMRGGMAALVPASLLQEMEADEI